MEAAAWGQLVGGLQDMNPFLCDPAGIDPSMKVAIARLASANGSFVQKTIQKMQANGFEVVAKRQCKKCKPMALRSLPPWSLSGQCFCKWSSAFLEAANKFCRTRADGCNRDGNHTLAPMAATVGWANYGDLSNRHPHLTNHPHLGPLGLRQDPADHLSFS